MMTTEQIKIIEERKKLENRIRRAKRMIDKARKELNSLCRKCKHDSTSSWVQSASGNESMNICSLCGADV